MNSSEKQKRLIKYLLKIANMNSKVEKSLDNYEKVFWLNDVPHERGCFSKVWSDEKGNDKDAWMEMQRQDEPAIPKIPAICKNWVESDSLNDKSNSPKLLNETTVEIEVTNEETGIKSFVKEAKKLEDCPEIQKDWNNYLKDYWNNWKKCHDDWEKLQKLYGELYSIHQSLFKAREEYELVLGVGLLAFRDIEGKIFKRHLIVADAELNLNKENGRLTLSVGQDGCRLRVDSNIFENGLPQETEEEIGSVLEETDDDPFNFDNIEKGLKIILNSVCPDGEYKRQFDPIKNSEKPIVTFSPAIILRKRSAKGLVDALENMERQIDNGAKVSGLFAKLVDMSSDDGENNEESCIVSSDEMIFFPKPCNKEQKAIVQKLNRASGILVQGPPGTGKSHTIANLICHLLAKGKRILVTAKTPRALSVLRGQLQENTKSLAISLLGTGAEEKQLLEQSVNSILNKEDFWSEEEKVRTSRQLQQELDTLKQNRERDGRRYRDIIEAETLKQSVACNRYSGTAKEIAEIVNSERNSYSWFKDNPHLDKEFLLSPDELLEILRDMQKNKNRKEELNLDCCDIDFSYNEFAEVADGLKSAYISGSVLNDHMLKTELSRFPIDGVKDFVYKIQTLHEVKQRFDSLSEKWIVAEFNKMIDGSSSLYDILEKTNEILSGENIKTLEELKEMERNLHEIEQRFYSSSEKWVAAEFNKMRDGNYILYDIYKQINAMLQSIENVSDIAEDYKISFPNDDNIKMIHDDAMILLDYIQSGKSISGFKSLIIPKAIKNCMYVFEKVKINDKTCSKNVLDLKRLTEILSFRIRVEKTWEILREIEIYGTESPYSLQIAKINNISNKIKDIIEAKQFFDEYQEKKKFIQIKIREVLLSLEEIVSVRNELPLHIQIVEIKNINNKIKDIIKAKEIFDECNDYIDTNRICIDLSSHKNLSNIIEVCNDVIIGKRRKESYTKISSLEERLINFSKRKNAHPIMNALLQAVKDRDPIKYKEGKLHLDYLLAERKAFIEFKNRLKEIEKAIPKTVKEMDESCDEHYWESRIKQIENAWYWSQANDWITNYVNKNDIPQIKVSLKRTEDKIGSIIAELASLNSWGFCVNRLTDDHKRHMKAWQLSVRKLGKGTGKHANRHRREAQRSLNECREAIPAWIMPLHSVWNNVKAEPEIFDVVIVDEASQCGLQALPLFYLAKKILIVGDDKQISPDNVGTLRDDVNRWKNEYLCDVYDFGQFDIDSSLFDIGTVLFNSKVVLREHFRCMPEIIRFSNELCYSSTPLIPMKQYGVDRLHPLEHVFLNNGYNEGDGQSMYNKVEAEAITDKIVQLCKDEKYGKKSIGVIILQGEKQAKQIEGLLLNKLDQNEIVERRIVCGKSSQFQGDERDIILLSMVVAKASANNDRLRAFADNKAEQRFNVAMSRAKEQVILFHSVKTSDLSPNCLRRKLIEFFEKKNCNSVAGITLEELEKLSYTPRYDVNTPKPFDSWFEVDVAIEIMRRGYRITPQYEIAGRRIDLVVEGGRSKLAVECDGEYWHGNDRYEEDMQRQRQLERCGWEFFRVRSSSFYFNKENALEGLWKLLNERNIFPCATGFSEVEEKDSTHFDNDAISDDVNDATEQDSHNNSKDRILFSDFALQDMNPTQISECIIKVLEKCPNTSCKTDDLTTLVLKELRIITRGAKRKKFWKKVMKQLKFLEQKGYLKQYKAKNKRVKLMV